MGTELLGTSSVFTDNGVARFTVLALSLLGAGSDFTLRYVTSLHS